MADAAQNAVALSIDGALYEGWTGVSISRALDTLSSEFRLSLTDREKTGAARLNLRAGTASGLTIDSETLITGYIDTVAPSLDGGTHTLDVSGRDKAADLIDCSAVVKGGSWRNVPLETIAAELAAPFGITVTAKASTAPNITRFALQQGETVHAAIERLCRYRALLAVSTRDGQVELIQPGQGAPVADLIEGQNCVRLSAKHNVADRYSEYIIKGQASGSDEANGKTVASPRASAKDPAIKRYRPLIIVGEEQSDIAALEKRAKFEATTRAARAQEVSITVQGWRRPDGALWDFNMLCRVMAPSLFIDATLLVTAVELTRDDAGTLTTLTLSPPEALSMLPISEKADASAIGGTA